MPFMLERERERGVVLLVVLCVCVGCVFLKLACLVFSIIGCDLIVMILLNQ